MAHASNYSLYIVHRNKVTRSRCSHFYAQIKEIFGRLDELHDTLLNEIHVQA
jgi:hypothetical protein